MSTPPTAAPKPAPAKTGAVVDLPAVRVARPAAPRRRHWLAVGSFALCVVLPVAASFAYLYTLAADQYASRVAFSVRSAESTGSGELLGVLSTSFGGGVGPDAEILYDFIRSQAMLERVTAALPLETMFNRPQDDVVFRLGEDRPVEDLLDYWNWMIDVSYDVGSGIVRFEARAFDPEDARAIAAFVLDESTRLVNDLSRRAREDAVSVAREVLEEAEDRLRGVRRELRAFRNLEQLPDPTETARASVSLVSTLEAELAQARIELDTQLTLVGDRGPRVPVLRQRIDSLTTQITTERARLGAGAGDGGDRAYADIIADYEDLVVDREFAEKAYVSALASYDHAQVEARRQMRYLSPHIAPTTSVEAEYPQRALIGAMTAVVLVVTWAVLLLILYNIRDRR